MGLCRSDVGFVGFCERYEEILPGEREEEDRDMVLETLKDECEVRAGRPMGPEMYPEERYPLAYPERVS